MFPTIRVCESYLETAQTMQKSGVHVSILEPFQCLRVNASLALSTRFTGVSLFEWS